MNQALIVLRKQLYIVQNTCLYHNKPGNHLIYTLGKIYGEQYPLHLQFDTIYSITGSYHYYTCCVSCGVRPAPNELPFMTCIGGDL